jgi:hypothetical protein
MDIKVPPLHDPVMDGFNTDDFFQMDAISRPR